MRARCTTTGQFPLVAATTTKHALRLRNARDLVQVARHSILNILLELRSLCVGESAMRLGCASFSSKSNVPVVAHGLLLEPLQH